MRKSRSIHVRSDVPLRIAVRIKVITEYVVYWTSRSLTAEDHPDCLRKRQNDNVMFSLFSFTSRIDTKY